MKSLGESLGGSGHGGSRERRPAGHRGRLGRRRVRAQKAGDRPGRVRLVTAPITAQSPCFLQPTRSLVQTVPEPRRGDWDEGRGVRKR